MTHFVQGVGVLWLAERDAHGVCLSDQWRASATSASDQSRATAA